jgi:DNA-directed RNA polymerase specialized sigma24 family protein
MSSAGSVTHWIGQLKAGDPAAAQQLWERYFRRLVGLARKKLQDTPRGAADEEDVALSAFHSFCQGVAGGRFPRLLDRDDLWQLLMLITARKAADLVQYERRLKRGGAGPGQPRAAAAEVDLEHILSQEPTPEFAFQVAESCQRLLSLLRDEELRTIALRKMEGYTNEEIAAQLGCALRTVRRRLRLIRSTWEQEIAP